METIQNIIDFLKNFFAWLYNYFLPFFVWYLALDLVWKIALVLAALLTIVAIVVFAKKFIEWALKPIRGGK